MRVSGRMERVSSSAPTIDLDVVTHEGVKVEQANGDVDAVSLIVCLLGEAIRGDVKPTVARAQSADERSNRGSSHGALAMLDLGYDVRALQPKGSPRASGDATTSRPPSGPLGMTWAQ